MKETNHDVTILLSVPFSKPVAARHPLALLAQIEAFRLNDVGAPAQ